MDYPPEREMMDPIRNGFSRFPARGCPAGRGKKIHIRYALLMLLWSLAASPVIAAPEAGTAENSNTIGGPETTTGPAPATAEANNEGKGAQVEGESEGDEFGLEFLQKAKDNETEPLKQIMTSQGPFVNMGFPVWKLYGTIGFNYLTVNQDFGMIGLFRTKRFTNFTFYDLQVHSFLVPAFTAGSGENTYYGLIRFKKSYIQYDFPWLYEWSIYQLKTSTLENLRMRAILETGYGAFLARVNRADFSLAVNLELGVVFDYSSLDAYAENISSGLAKTALEFDGEFYPFEAKALFYFYYEMINPDGPLGANQTRFDFESSASYFLDRKNYFSLGIIYTQFLALPVNSVQVDKALTVYGAYTYKLSVK